MSPVTLLERQWYTLVTKMPPRHDRSELASLVRGLQAACPGEEEGGTSTWPRYRLSVHHRLLTAVEMATGAVQVVAGATLVAHTLLQLAGLGWAGEGRYSLALVIGAYVLKDATNWASPTFELYLKPAKYNENKRWWCASLAFALKRAGGADGLVSVLAAARERGDEGDEEGDGSALLAAVRKLRGWGEASPEAGEEGLAAAGRESFPPVLRMEYSPEEARVVAEMVSLGAEGAEEAEEARARGGAENRV